MVNPMLVEGQIRGGVAQGIGTALCEEIPYDAAGQPLAATLLDYHMPGAFELPPIKIGHLHNPATVRSGATRPLLCNSWPAAISSGSTQGVAASFMEDPSV